MANWFKGENFMRQSGSPSNNVNDFNSNTTEKVKVIDITKSVKDSTKQLNDFFKDAKASVDKFNKYTYDQSVIYSKKIVKVYEKAYQDMFKNLGMQAEKQAQDAANKIKEASEPTAPNNKRNDETRAKSFGENIWDSFGKALKSYLNSWVQRFEKGVTNIVTAYNNTYDTVAALTQINQGIYRGQQRAIQSSIKAGGFERSVSISSVMTELNTVVTNGITDINTATEKAFNDVITKKISPYLETSTNAYTDLYMALGKDQFAIQMVGISSALTQIAGDSRVFKQTINNMLTQLTDVGMFARKQLFGKDVADAQAQLNYLVSKGELSSSQATDILDQAINIVRNPYSGGYGSGNALARIATSKTSDTGLQNVGTVTRNLLSEYLWFTQQTAGTSNIGTAATASTLGLNGYIYSLTPQGVQQAFAAGQTASNNIKQYGTEQLTALANNSYTTETEQRDIMLENNSLTIAFAYQIFPSEMNAIKALLTSILGAISIQGLFGGGSGKGLFSGSSIKGVTNALKSAPALAAEYGVSGAYGADLALFSGGGPLEGSIISKIGKFGKVAFNQASMVEGLAATGGVLIGGAEIAHGISGALDNTRSGTSRALSGVEAAGGAAGIGALIGLGASNPIGWIALGIGGIAAAASAINEEIRKNMPGRKLAEEQAEKFKELASTVEDIQINEENIKEYTNNLATDINEYVSKELNKATKKELEKRISNSGVYEALGEITSVDINKALESGGYAIDSSGNITAPMDIPAFFRRLGTWFDSGLSTDFGAQIATAVSGYARSSGSQIKLAKELQLDTADPTKDLIDYLNMDLSTSGGQAAVLESFIANANAKLGVSKEKVGLEQFVALLKSKNQPLVNQEIKYKADELGIKFANGLLEVPYNGFPAMLHEGERVLTAPEALEYRNMKFGAVTGNNYSIIIAAIEAVGNAVVSAIKGQPSNIASLEDDGVMRIGTNRISLSPVF